MSFLDGLVQFRCTLCNAPMGECGCWSECGVCGHFYMTGKGCLAPHPRLRDQGSARTASSPQEARDGR